MHPFHFRHLTIAAAFALAPIAGVAAQDVPAAPAGAQSSDVFAAPPVADETLGSIAGKADVAQRAESENNAEVAGNSVGDNAVTGEVRMDGNSFQNMSGLSMVNVNTGNNVAMNAAMNVNISIVPTPQ